MSKKVVKNEKQFAEWFRGNYKKLGYSKIVRGDISRCPDFIMLKNGKEVGVELETFSSNFLAHKHQLEKVDEILCLIKDVELGKPVIEVNQITFEGNQKVTLSIDSIIYKDFQKYCWDNAFALSKKVEFFMKDCIDEKEGDR